MRIKAVKVDDRHFWKRQSFLGENISNGNWIIATILLLSAGGALQQGWIVAAIGLGVAGALSIVWNEAVAKTATIVGGWLAIGGGSAWGLSFACDAMFGMPGIGHVIGLIVAVVGILMTID